MQNLQDGKIQLSQITLCPDLTESAFLAQYPDAPIFTKFDPHRSYRLPTIELGDRSFLPTIWFSNYKLAELHLTFDNPAMRSWDAYSEEAQKIVQSDNAGWATRYFNISVPARFSWGAIDSIFDPKSGNAHVLIRYC